VHAHRWRGDREQNPYTGYLALADQFVVTSDSVSMVAEAEFTGKPVYLFSLEDGPRWWMRRYNYRFDALMHRLAATLGPRRMRRDAEGMMRRLIAAGRAAWLGEAAPRRDAERSREDDAGRAALAVAALFSARGTGNG
jgi:hypothetical protein